MHLVFGKGIGRYRQNRRFTAARQFADAFGGRDSIQGRHLHVHHDGRVSGFPDLADGKLSVQGRADAQANVFQQVLGHFKIQGLIVNNQNASPLMVLADCFFGLGHFSLVERGPVRVSGQPCRKPERAADTGRALDAGLAAHQFGQPSGDGQAKPGAAVLA